MHELNFMLYIAFSHNDIPALQEAHARIVEEVGCDPTEQATSDLSLTIADIINLGTEIPPIWEGGQGAMVVTPITTTGNSTLDIIETFVRDMENASLDEFVSDEHKTDISRAFRLLRSVADECSLGASDSPDLNEDEDRAVKLIDGVQDLASFAETCGSDDLEERLTDEVARNDLDINVDNVDFVKVLGYFQNN